MFINSIVCTMLIIMNVLFAVVWRYEGIPWHWQQDQTFPPWQKRSAHAPNCETLRSSSKLCFGHNVQLCTIMNTILCIFYFCVFVSTEFRRARVSGLCTQTRARRSGMGAVLDHKHPLHPTDLHRNWPNPRRRCLLKSSALRYYWTSGALLRKRVQTGHSPGWPHSRQSLEGRIGSLQDGQVRLSSFIFKSYSKLVMKCAYFSATTHRPSTCQQKRRRNTAVSRCCGCTEKRKSGQRSEPWTSSCFGRTNREVRVLTHHEPCTISHHEVFLYFSLNAPYCFDLFVFFCRKGASYSIAWLRNNPTWSHSSEHHRVGSGLGLLTYTMSSSFCPFPIRHVR